MRKRVYEFPGDPNTEVRDLDTLRRLLLEGAASPLAGPADAAYFERLHQRIRKHVEGGKAGGGAGDDYP
jgi:hypothetical protein